MNRQRTGKGRRIDVSLVESMTRFLACRISSYLGSGEVPTPIGRHRQRHRDLPAIRDRGSADQRLAWGPTRSGRGSGRLWAIPNMALAPNSPAMPIVGCARFDRGAYPVAPAGTNPGGMAGSVRRRGGCPPARSTASIEVAADPELQARSLIFALEGEDGRLMPQIGLGIHIDGAPSIPASGPPTLGQHTAEIMATLESPAAA
jgi:crotonobetainyl-CoA:carnitine CoA-transferase CaiB-like acyl-CoA transferase